MHVLVVPSCKMQSIFLSTKYLISPSMDGWLEKMWCEIFHQVLQLSKLMHNLVLAGRASFPSHTYFSTFKTILKLYRHSILKILLHSNMRVVYPHGSKRYLLKVFSGISVITRYTRETIQHLKWCLRSDTVKSFDVVVKSVRKLPNPRLNLNRIPFESTPKNPRSRWFNEQCKRGDNKLTARTKISAALLKNNVCTFKCCQISSDKIFI